MRVFPRPTGSQKRYTVGQPPRVKGGIADAEGYVRSSPKLAFGTANLGWCAEIAGSHELRLLQESAVVGQSTLVGSGGYGDAGR